MGKIIYVLLSMLAFFTLQVFAQCSCNSPATVTDPSQSPFTIFVEDGYYEPDCLTISKNIKVQWQWKDGPHTVTSNNGTYGNCNPGKRIAAGDDGDVLPSPAYTPGLDGLTYMCSYGNHCQPPKCMVGKIVVTPTPI
uniref:Aspartate carbamoyltransferase n=1 Tax=Anthurium amnicola TaxID=1678845 RepID=A0A1D1Y411_9ARAE